jgi:hypothetical protein
MIPIRIECGCGQHYAFDVEPVEGHMPTAVKCPGCGADGTAAANAFIAQAIPKPVVTATPVARPRLHVSVPSPAPALLVAGSVAEAPPAAAVESRPGIPGREIDHAKVMNEARAKIFWGDRPEEVVKFVMMQGVDYEEASIMVRGMYKERLGTLRGIGTKKIIFGILLLCVPIVAFLFFLRLGFFPLTPMAIAIMIGLYGGWLILKGTLLLVAPKLGSEDTADIDE